MEIAVTELETLVVGTDEILIVRFCDDIGLEALERFVETLAEGPLNGRAVVFHGDVEFAKVAK